MEPELVEEFIREFHAKVNRQRRHVGLSVSSRRRDLLEVTRKLDSLIEAIADGLRAPGLRARGDDLEQRKVALEAEIAAAPTPAPRLHPDPAELYRRKVESLHEALAHPTTRHEAIEILRGLVECMIVHPTDNGHGVELVGEIANIVAVATSNGKAASFEAAVPDAYWRAGKVVAGRGFEPLTFRL